MSLNLNILYNRYFFYTRTQKPDENLEKFINDLIELAVPCDFDNLQERIRDQIIVGIKDNVLRGVLFKLENPELSDFLKLLKENGRIKGEININELASGNKTGSQVAKQEADSMISSTIQKEKGEINCRHSLDFKTEGTSFDQEDVSQPTCDAINSKNPFQKNGDNKHENVEIIEIKDEDEEEIKIKDENEVQMEDNIINQVESNSLLVEASKKAESGFDTDRESTASTSTITNTPEICRKCNKTFKSSRSLSNHMRVHNNGKLRLFFCKVCEKKFPYKCRLRTHNQVHNKNKDFKCDSCGKEFTTKRGLEIHVLRHFV